MGEPNEIHGDIVPRPDPTRLTTEQLSTAVAAVKEIVFARFDAVTATIGAINATVQAYADRFLTVPVEVDRKISQLKDLGDSRFSEVAIHRESLRIMIETRISGMDKAVELLQKRNDEMPPRVDEKINALSNVLEEKLSSIQVQFKERDVRTEQTSKDSKVAVDAALQAAKEAVGEQNKSSALAIAKSETSVTKQIDQLYLLIQTGAKAVDDKFTDIKDRITRLEGNDQGVSQAKDGFHSTGTMAIAVISAVVAIVAVVAAIWKR
ncbi:MAG: hypothetical protein NVS1B11_37800 [Terriglobales bacterium]